MTLPGSPETPFGGSPARCSTQLGDGVIAELVLGEDLLLVVAHRNPNQKGLIVHSNDAGELFHDAAWHVELFDSDFNFLGTLGRFTRPEHAMSSVPTLVDVARTWFPNHVVNRDPAVM